MQEFCTNCPERKDCKVRPLFYSDEQYAEYRQQVICKTTHLVSLMEFPKDAISIGLNIGISMMDKRRERELELHPTYSIN